MTPGQSGRKPHEQATIGPSKAVKATLAVPCSFTRSSQSGIASSVCRSGSRSCMQSTWLQWNGRIATSDMPVPLAIVSV